MCIFSKHITISLYCLAIFHNFPLVTGAPRWFGPKKDTEKLNDQGNDSSESDSEIAETIWHSRTLDPEDTGDKKEMREPVSKQSGIIQLHQPSVKQ